MNQTPASIPQDACSDAVIEGYLRELRFERGYSPRTIEAYRTDLLELFSCVQGLEDATGPARPGSPHDWSQLDELSIRRWVARQSAQGLSARSIARRLSAWRGFFDALLEQGLVKTNPVRRVRAPRASRLLPRALTPDQAVRLVAAPYPGAPACADEASSSAGDGATDEFESARDCAMFELLYSSGLRLSELVSLDIRFFETPPERSLSWLTMAEAELTVTGKGARMRRVPIGRAAMEALNHWLSVRADFVATRPRADTRALFLGRRGARIAPRVVQQRLRLRGQQTGQAVAVHPHMLRHSFASHILQSSGDLRAVQEMLGHTSIASTQIYTALDFQRLAAVYDAAHPRARRAVKDSGQ